MDFSDIDNLSNFPSFLILYFFNNSKGMIKQEILAFLEENKNPQNVEGMAKFGISSDNTYGISMPKLRALAKLIGKNHDLASELWDTGIHEAKILCALIGEPTKVTKEQADKWVSEIDSWDVCDQLCGNLMDKVTFVYDKVFEWADNDSEFIRRSAFSTIAYYGVHKKKEQDEFFESFFPLILKYSTDERNFVKKAVNWALRQIGKRSMTMNAKAIDLAEEIQRTFPDSKSARWIAVDAIRELKDEKTLKRIKE